MTNLTEQKVVFSSKECIEIINIYLQERGSISTQIKKKSEENIKTEDFGYASKTIQYFTNLIEQIIKKNNEILDNKNTHYLFSYNNWRGTTQFLVTVKETSQHLCCNFSIYANEEVSIILTPEKISEYIN
jgi:hypothetical protein